MPQPIAKYTLSKEERLHSQKRIDALFASGQSFIAYPLRIVYTQTQANPSEPRETASMMVSVSKKRFKRAVKRNRIKRLVREAFRLHKQALINIYQPTEQTIDIAFLYLKNELPSYAEIEKAMLKTIATLKEKIQEKEAPTHENNP